MQLRGKNSPSFEMVNAARKIANLAKKNRAFFLVNDRLDVALACGARGLHVGEGDQKLKVIRRLMGKHVIAGKTVHSLSEMKRASREGYDYLSAGAVFDTPLKRHLKGKGLGFIKKIRAASRKPLLAIGGINETNAGEVLKAGANGICVARGSLRIKKVLNAVK